MTKHKFVGWGYDSSICEHCYVNAYDPAIQHARRHGGGEYCENLTSEKEAYEESERSKPARKKEALDKVRAVLTEEEYILLGLRFFGEYRERDRIDIRSNS